MNIAKNIFLLVLSLLIPLLISCSDDIVEPESPSAMVLEDLSVVQTKIQFSVDRIYHYKIAIESSYLPSDSLVVGAFFTNGTSRVSMKMYDDGISDDSLRNDLVASNNIWSGGINSTDFPNEGDWYLNVEVLITDSIIVHEHIFSDVQVSTNTAPIINFILEVEDGITLESGFPTKNVIASIFDPDNDALGNNDNQTLKLEIRNRDNIDKDFLYVREDPFNDMIITLYPTLASGLSTNDQYTFTFIATDYYGESDSLSFGNIRIENTEPDLYQLNYPDTVFVPAVDSTYFSITTKVYDPQGHLESQDIGLDGVELTLMVSGTPYTYLMRDDGDFNNSGDIEGDDGIYTKNFKVLSTNVEDVYPFTITATDKVGNVSNEFSGELIFIKDSKSKTNRDNNVQKFNYSSPFNIK